MLDFSSARQARFGFKVKGTAYAVLQLSARESVSSLFQADLDIISEEDIPFEQMIAQEGVLEIMGREEPRYFNGIIKSFNGRGRKGRFYLYSLELVPSLWLLTLRKNVRIFQNKSVPEIIREVLTDGGILSDRFSFRMKGDFEKREYCVQYRETDYDFISRLMAEEGLFYFFDHDKEKHLMILGNTVTDYVHIKGERKIPFNAGTSLLPEEEYVSAFELKQRIHSGKVTLKDYHFIHPNRTMKADFSDKKYEQLEVYDYPGKYVAFEKGESLSRIRLEEQMRFKEVGEGKSISPRLMPGSLFTLKEHPVDRFNKGYMVISVMHEGTQPQVLEEMASPDQAASYESKFTVIPDQTVFRPATDIPKPKIEGIQTAVVTGTKGEEIYTDRHGRVKVQFHWDRVGKYDEKSSCWVRVSQAWAGKGWGSLFIPRIGQEVVVDFIDGDPDRPLVTGAVYHTENQPPYALPDERTKSTIKSSSSLNGEGFNEIRIEDAKGREELFIHGEKDWNIVVKNDKTQSIGHDEQLTVENDRTKTVKKNQKESVGENKNIEVGMDHTEKINRNESISVSENANRTIGKNHSLRVEKSANESIGEDLSLSVGKNYALSVKESARIGVDNEVRSQVGGNLTLFARQQALIDVADQLTLRCGESFIILKSNGEIHINGHKVNIKALSELSLKGTKITGN